MPMRLNRRHLFAAVAAGGAALATRPLVAGESGHAGSGITPDAALATLKKGNQAFTMGRAFNYGLNDAQRRAFLAGQRPFATIVCCSDSRAAPEQIFETGVGQLFVIRNAGSTVANPQAMGSIEYSVLHLGVPLVVVLGHSACGAVKAAIEVVEKDAKLPGQLGQMVEPIVPAVHTAHKIPGDVVENTVRENVHQVVHDLRAPSQRLLAAPRRAGKLKIVGAEYHFASGIVEFFDVE
ncbi:carbonic anhydrase [Sphingomonas sp.]|jgi:carbonic anhydrase|uniref:carbonic anhydrase n=2 Tax=unclassified Sphingomonas TaxID=196159 RepID=UPI00307E350A